MEALERLEAKRLKMKDPFCKNELLDPSWNRWSSELTVVVMTAMRKSTTRPTNPKAPCGGTRTAPSSTSPSAHEASVSSEGHVNRGQERYRGKYVGEGFLIVDMEYMCSIYNDDPFIREWRTVNSHWLPSSRNGSREIDDSY